MKNINLSNTGKKSKSRKEKAKNSESKTNERLSDKVEKDLKTGTPWQDKLKALIQTWRKEAWFLPTLISVFIVVFSLFAYFFVYPYVKPSEDVQVNVGNYIAADETNDKKDDPSLSEPSEPKIYESPINGVLMDKEGYEDLMNNAPIAVIVNNHVQARQQANLSKADVVYEATVEGGITRYMAVYWSNQPDKVGPIRSARQYYIEWLSPYDPIFIHDGYASDPNLPAVNAGPNMFSYGINTISTQGAWRDSSDGKISPHNEYSSIETAIEIGEDGGFNDFPEDMASWEFKKDEPFIDTEKEYRVNVSDRNNSLGAYSSGWVYNPDSNDYTRYTGGQLTQDQGASEPTKAKNVVVLETNVTPTFNYKNHIIVETIGSGTAKILQDGKVIEANWSKDSRTDRIKFTDESGDEFEFNRGLIWITAISETDGAFDIIR